MTQQNVTLEALSADHILAVLALRVSDKQLAAYPRSNGCSVAEGNYPPDSGPEWMRAICNNGEPVGFMMTSERPAQCVYFLWRMMIDYRHQGSGCHGSAVQENQG